MLTRRSLIIAATGAALLASFPARILRAQDSGAAGFIETNGKQILAMAPDAEGNPQTRQRLLDLVNQVLDVNGIARFALGPYVRQIDQAQMQRYQQLFHQVISNGVTARLSTYSNATLSIGHSDPDDGATLVHTVITRPGFPPANVDWLVGTVGGQTKIMDVIAEGTSLRQTERSDYTSYLQSHGGDLNALLSAIEAQVNR